MRQVIIASHDPSLIKSNWLTCRSGSELHMYRGHQETKAGHIMVSFSPHPILPY